jgi:hypothetical protein
VALDADAVAEDALAVALELALVAVAALAAALVAFVLTSPATVLAWPAQVFISVLNVGNAVPRNVSARLSKVAGSAVVGTLPRLEMLCVIVVIFFPP